MRQGETEHVAGDLLDVCVSGYAAYVLTTDPLWDGALGLTDGWRVRGAEVVVFLERFIDAADYLYYKCLTSRGVGYIRPYAFGEKCNRTETQRWAR